MVLCWRTRTGAVEKLQAMWFRLGHVGGGQEVKLTSAPPEGVLKDASGPWLLGSAGQEMGSSGRILKGGSSAM